MNEHRREIKFILRNSPNFENARKFIENHCNANEIKTFEFKPYKDDEIALFIYDNDNQYVIYLDYDDIDIKVIFNGRIIQLFTKDVAWIHAVRFVKEQINKGE